MTMNRVLQFVKSAPCPACSRLRRVEAILFAAAVEAKAIEAVAGDILEFWIPDAARVLKPKADDLDSLGDDDGERVVGIRLFLAIEPSRVAAIDEDLRVYAVSELRRISNLLDAAAARIEPASGIEGDAT